MNHGSVQGMGQTEQNNSGDLADIEVDESMTSPKPEPIEVSFCLFEFNSNGTELQMLVMPLVWRMQSAKHEYHAYFAVILCKVSQ